MSSSCRLVGISALVTGGGSGIGRAACQIFAREGANVVIVDVDENGMDETIKSLTSDHGNQHFSIKTDVTSSEQTAEVFARAEEKLGKKVTVLVNSAGIARRNAFDAISEGQFDSIININVKGTFLMSQEFVKSLKNYTGQDETRGSLINIASLAGARGFPKNASYCASKFAVVGLTKTIAQEYPDYKVRSNAILPGFTDTPLIKNSEEMSRNAFLQVTPMKRMAKPEEIANVCLFLASDESSYVNGASIEVSGGLMC